MDFEEEYAGKVRSLEIANVRIHTDTGWKDVHSVWTGIGSSHHTEVLKDAYGSWEAGAIPST